MPVFLLGVGERPLHIDNLARNRRGGRHLPLDRRVKLRDLAVQHGQLAAARDQSRRWRSSSQGNRAVVRDDLASERDERQFCMFARQRKATCERVHDPRPAKQTDSKRHVFRRGLHERVGAAQNAWRALQIDVSRHTAMRAGVDRREGDLRQKSMRGSAEGGQHVFQRADHDVLCALAQRRFDQMRHFNIDCEQFRDDAQHVAQRSTRVRLGQNFFNRFAVSLAECSNSSSTAARLAQRHAAGASGRFRLAACVAARQAWSGFGARRLRGGPVHPRRRPASAPARRVPTFQCRLRDDWRPARPAFVRVASTVRGPIRSCAASALDSPSH